MKTGNFYKKEKRRDNAFDGAALPIVEGVLDCKADRFGFLPCKDGDVFIGGRELCGARHGDKVRVLVTKDYYVAGGKRKRDGRVIEIAERNPFNVVATIVYENHRYFAEPDDKRYGSRLPVSALCGAREYDKVIIKLLPSTVSSGDCASVTAVLGRYDDVGMDVYSVIVSHNLRTEFPRACLEEAAAIPDEIDKNEANKSYRADFRNRLAFTIDGSDSKDFDDAVSLEKTSSGYELGVYIADVAQYVKEGSPLDCEARARGTSVYLADRVIPMLPEKLSNGICSLNEGEDRLALCALISLDEDGNVTGGDVKEGVIRSAARLTYDGVQAALDGEPNAIKNEKVLSALELMKELALKRMKKRRENGCIEFELAEADIKFDAAGRVKELKRRESLLSMKIIEEFMILANCLVAEKFCALKVPFIYRNHDRPAPEKIESFNDWLDAVGAKSSLKEKPTPRQVASLLENVKPDLAVAANRLALRSMAKACYESHNEGHFGLAEEFYCHFTSPIRRYPDLAIHRIIKAYLHGGLKATRGFKDFTEQAAKHSSDCERVAQDCERKVDDLKKAEYLGARIGREFEGAISSVTEFGFFVELDNSAEGLVRTGKIPGAYFDSKRLMIVGGGKKYKLGDRLKVIVEKVAGDRVDFDLSDRVE